MPDFDGEELITATRIELNDTGEHIDETILQYRVGNAEEKVLEKAPSGASDRKIKEAIAVEAAWKVVTKNKDAFLDAKSGADLSKSWDVSEFIARLKEDREETLDELFGGSFFFQSI